MNAEEERERLAEAISCRYEYQSVTLLLIYETSLHYRGAQIIGDTSCGMVIDRIFLWYGTLAHKAKAGGDTVFRAILASLVVGIDGITPNP